MEFIVGIIFIFLYITFFLFLGKSVVKDDNDSYSILIGFVIYAFLQTILGTITQIFKIEYEIYKVSMIIMCLFLIVLIYQKNKASYSLAIMARCLINHIIKHKFVYILSGLFTAFSLLNIEYMWMGNHQDDGYYLLKVALAPLLESDYDIVYASGFEGSLGLARSVNTFELDYAFWSDLLGIHPSVFCKFIMVYLNYCLILFGFNNLIQVFDNRKKESSILLCTIMFFIINPNVFQNYGILNQQDGWHFNYAVWYGSALVRCLSLNVLLYPVVKEKQINIKIILLFIITSVTLVSRASQALPIIFLSIVGIVMYYLFFKCKNKKLMCLVIILGLSLVPDVNVSLANTTNVLFFEFFKTPLIFLALLTIVISTYILKNQGLFIFTSIYFFMLIIASIPKINNLFLHLCTVDFVMARTITMFSFYAIILAFICFGLLISKYSKSEKLLYILCASFTIACILFCFKGVDKQIGIENALRTLKKNPQFVPKSTLVLSEYLQNLSVKYSEKITVYGPAWIEDGGVPHAVGTMLRINAPDIYSISSLPRFNGIVEDVSYKSFSTEIDDLYNKFRSDPYAPDNIIMIHNLINDYPIDVFYETTFEVIDVLVKECNYHVVDIVSGMEYSILVSDELFTNFYE